MVKLARIAAVVAAMCLVTAAPAHAAFFPDLKVALTPTTPGASSALTLVMAQPAADTAIERLTLSLPPGFTATGALGAAPCPVASVQTGTCEPASQIGAFVGRLDNATPFTGTIHKTGPASFGMRISVLGGAVTQTVQGLLTKRANGGLDMRLDQLPALPMTLLALRLWGGGHSLIATPQGCGTYTIDGKFTSRLDELAIDRTFIPITGCAGVPTVQVENVRMTEKAFRAGGSLYNARTAIAWWASRAVNHTDLRIERRKDGVWRAAGVLVGTGNPGDNLLRWDGRVKNRKLEPGRYSVLVQPDGSEPAKRLRFRILP
jgi:hypothetical protein